LESTINNDKLPKTKEIVAKCREACPGALENVLSIWMLENVLNGDILDMKAYLEMFHEPSVTLPAGFNEQENNYL
jgi:hypothetical protein